MDLALGADLKTWFIFVQALSDVHVESIFCPMQQPFGKLTSCMCILCIVRIKSPAFGTFLGFLDVQSGLAKKGPSWSGTELFLIASPFLIASIHYSRKIPNKEQVGKHRIVPYGESFPYYESSSSFINWILASINIANFYAITESLTAGFDCNLIRVGLFLCHCRGRRQKVIRM